MLIYLIVKDQLRKILTRAEKAIETMMTIAITNERLVMPFAELSVTLFCISRIVDLLLRDRTTQKTTRVIQQTTISNSNISPDPDLFCIGFATEP